MTELLNSLSSLNSVYWLLLFAGAVIMVASFALDGMFHLGDDGSVVPALALFLVLFGGVGVFTLTTLGWGPAASLGAAAITSTAGSVGFYFGVLKFIKSREATLSNKREDVIGHNAEVSLSIRQNQPGQITFTTPSGRTSAPALSQGGIEILQGTLVEIVESVGTTYIVRPRRLKATDAPVDADHPDSDGQHSHGGHQHR